MTILGDTRQIRMSGPRNRDSRRNRLDVVRHSLGRHDNGPVRVIRVFDDHADGATEGASMPDTRYQATPIGLDGHAAAPSVATLTPSQIDVDIAA